MGLGRSVKGSRSIASKHWALSVENRQYVGSLSEGDEMDESLAFGSHAEQTRGASRERDVEGSCAWKLGVLRWFRLRGCPANRRSSVCKRSFVAQHMGQGGLILEGFLTRGAMSE